jgi:transposase
MTKHRHIQLTTDERTQLEQLIKTGVHPARVIARARTLLLLDRSQGHKRPLHEVADAVMIGYGTVINIKRRYFAGGLERALYDLPRPGATPKIDGEVEARLLALACSDPPDGYGRWTLRLLADKLVELELVESISHVAVGEALKKTNSSRGR